MAAIETLAGESDAQRAHRPQPDPDPDSWSIQIPSNEDEDRVTAKRSVDWSELDSNLLRIILSRLGPIDHLRFSHVCRAWRWTRLANCKSPEALPGHQAPMLLIPRKTRFSCHHQFVSPSEGRTYTFNLADLFGQGCIGSTGSWLLLVSWPTRQDFFPPDPFGPNKHLYLYNPFSATKFKLPYTNAIIRKRAQIAISAEPSSPDFAVLILSCDDAKFHWVRANETKWSSRECYEVLGSTFVQIAALKGKFYALTSYGRLAYIDLGSDPILVWGKDTERIHFDQSHQDVYLVECGGELLAVIVSCASADAPAPNQHSRPMLWVLRLDMENRLWIGAVDMVKNKVLFLDKQGSMCREEIVVGGGGRVYTAGKDSFGVFDIRTFRGTVQRGDPVYTAIWVSPELIVGDRETSWWWVPLRKKSLYYLLAFESLAMQFFLIVCLLLIAPFVLIFCLLCYLVDYFSRLGF